MWYLNTPFGSNKGHRNTNAFGASRLMTGGQKGHSASGHRGMYISEQSQSFYLPDMWEHQEVSVDRMNSLVSSSGQCYGQHMDILSSIEDKMSIPVNTMQSDIGDGLVIVDCGVWCFISTRIMWIFIVSRLSYLVLVAYWCLMWDVAYLRMECSREVLQEGM